MSRRKEAALMAAGVVPPESASPVLASQSEEDRAYWFSVLPKPRQEVDCACVKNGPPQPFCVDCLGTGKHARRTTRTKSHRRATTAPEKA